MSPVDLAALFDGPTPALAEGLLGCRLTVAAPDGAVTVRLTETEAYGNAGEDPGAHSFRGRTERNAALFGWLHPAWAERQNGPFEPWHWEYTG